MLKYEFLANLQKRLDNLPVADRQKTLDYYAEMIDDRIEDGLPEEEAVAAIGAPAEIATQILGDPSLVETTASEKKGISATTPRKKRAAWEIVLLIAGSPVWVPLLAAAAIILLAVIIVLASLVIALWAIDLALSATGVALLLLSPFHFASGAFWSSLTCVGTGLFAVGLAIFLFHGCKQATFGVISLIYMIVYLTFRTVRDRLTKKGA